MTAVPQFLQKLINIKSHPLKLKGTDKLRQLSI